MMPFVQRLEKTCKRSVQFSQN